MPSTLSEDVLASLGAEVALPKIDHALKQLWEADNAKTRASLVNFAIYSEVPSSLARNSELLAHITGEHACRALLILSIPHAEQKRSRAWINAHCRPYQGKQVVCSEQISFVLEGGDAAQLQNVVFAHLDSDLPLIVWWQGALTKNFEERFYSRIDTLIIDSSAWADPLAEFEHLTKTIASETADFDVRDLSWTRSHFMRTALATAFQDARARERLPMVERIEISHLTGQRCAASLLAGWIMQRMGGTLDESTSGLAFTKPNDGRVTIDLTEKAEGCALQSLKFTGPQLDIDIQREATSAFVRTCIACQGLGHEEMLPADVVSDADLVVEQLSRVGGSTHYSNVLPLMPSLLRR